MITNANAIRLGALWLMLALGCAGCHPRSYQLQPEISYYPPQRLVKQLPSPFPPLSEQELKQDWAKELMMGRSFALEMDFYRAITCFKRALFLIPPTAQARRLEGEYAIFLAYYLAGKYQESVEAFESSELFFANEQFPALDELLILLYDAYLKNSQPDKAYAILCLLAFKNREVEQQLQMGSAIQQANFQQIDQLMASSETTPPTPLQENLGAFVYAYETQAKSVFKAQTLNALLPGAGYYYVGQKKTALTSFLINALFIAAAWQLFERGYIAGGIIVTSLETGWYLGGINGAGLEAKEYNQFLYQTLGKEMMLENRLFPVLMLQKGF